MSLEKSRLEDLFKYKDYDFIIKRLAKGTFSDFLKEIIIIDLIINYRCTLKNSEFNSKQLISFYNGLCRNNEEKLNEYLTTISKSRNPERNYNVAIRNLLSSNTHKNKNGLSHRKELYYNDEKKTYRLSEELIYYDFDKVLSRQLFIEKFHYIFNYYSFTCNGNMICSRCSKTIEYNDEVGFLSIVDSQKITPIPMEDIECLCEECKMEQIKGSVKNVYGKKK